MNQISRECLDFLREQFPTGSRIELSEMGSDPRPLEPGSLGTLDFIDDIGTFHVTWDNGRTLGVVIGEDRFSVLPPELTVMKLYMPLTADLYERNRWGDMEEDGTPLDGGSLRGYGGAILKALQENQMAEERERGIFEWIIVCLLARLYDYTDRHFSLFPVPFIMRLFPFCTERSLPL